MSGLIKNAGIIGTIEELLASLDSGEKKAEANTEAGSYMGGTTHPVADIDDRTDDASEGARSAENTDDVKSEPNRGQVVDETTPGPGAGQASVQMDIGMTSKETGTDPTAETDSVKPGKQDPGSSHPARTDNDELDGHKYANDYEALRAMWKRAEDIGSQLCAQIATESRQPARKKAEEGTAGSTNSQAGGVGVADGPRTEDGKIEAEDENGENPAKESAAAAGADLANVFAGIGDISHEDKVAADAVVVDALQDVVSLAYARAEKTAALYSAYAAELQKKAEGEEAGMDPAMMGGAGGGGEEIPPELLQQILAAQGGGAGGEMPVEGGGGGEDEAALMELLSQGGGGGGEMPAEGGDGEDEAALMAAMGGEGGAGMEGPVGNGGEGEIGPEELAMLEQILQQEGIDPSELEAALAGKQAAAKSASAAWRPKTAADRQKYAYMRNYIRELVGRSRAN